MSNRNMINFTVVALLITCLSFQVFQTVVVLFVSEDKLDLHSWMAAKQKFRKAKALEVYIFLYISIEFVFLGPVSDGHLVSVNTILTTILMT